MSISETAKLGQKKKRDLIIAGALLLFFAYIFTTNVLIRKKPAPAPAGPGDTSGQSMAEQLVLVTNMRLYDNLKNERLKLWDREWARDPFVPQSTTGLVKAVNLTLNGILWDDKAPKAIVNEKTLLIGDTIYGYTVVDIKQRSVILKTGEKNIELKVFRPVINDLSGT